MKAVRREKIRRKMKSFIMFYNAVFAPDEVDRLLAPKVFTNAARYALFNATKYVCMWEPSFVAYLARKRAEGKHYNVAISHAAKNLVRLIYALQTSGKAFQPAA